MISRKTTRTLILLLLLTAVVLACQPSTTPVPATTAPATVPPVVPATQTVAPTLVPPTSLSPEPSWPVPLPFPSFSAYEPLDVGARLAIDAILVFQGLDGTLLFTDPDLGVFRSEDLPAQDSRVSLAGGFATYLATDSTGGPGVAMVAADRDSIFAPVPSSTGDLGAWRLSPDGSHIAWLFDVTEVRPSMVDGCDSDTGCVGLIYDLVLTDNMGGQAEIVWNYIVESPAGVGGLDLIDWRDDSLTVFVGLDPGDLGPFYPPGFDAVFEVALSNEVEVRDRGEGYISAEEMVISADGRWLAVAGGPDSLTVESDDGLMFSVPYTVYPNPYTAQLKFSPSAEWLAWVRLTTPERELAAESLFLDVMSLQTGEVRSVASFEIGVEPASLPLVGPWLTDDLLVVHYAGQSWVVDVVSGQAGAWSPEIEGVVPVTTVGVID